MAAVLGGCVVVGVEHRLTPVGQAVDMHRPTLVVGDLIASLVLGPAEAALNWLVLVVVYRPIDRDDLGKLRLPGACDAADEVVLLAGCK